jgi:hypothetical protein
MLVLAIDHSFSGFLGSVSAPDGEEDGFAGAPSSSACANLSQSASAIGGAGFSLLNIEVAI